MPTKSRLLAHIDNAAAVATPVWPLRSFIATNPLAGFELLPFHEAIVEGARQLGGRGLPTRAMGRQALRDGEIHPAALEASARRRGQPERLEAMLHGPLHGEPESPISESPVDRLVIKWLTAFLDEGQATWSMPGRERGFYRAWRTLARYDRELPEAARVSELPEDPLDALLSLLAGVPEAQYEALLSAQLAALPGWAGYIRWRANHGHNPWQRAYPISLADYLAVRLSIGKLLGVTPKAPEADTAEANAEGLIWLEAWEESYRQGLIHKLREGQQHTPPSSRAEAQLVFCIDVRSEVLRRHLEASGPYQTLGFAGFFGVPVAYRGFSDEQGVDSCPVLLEPKYTISETPLGGQERQVHHHRQGVQHLRGLRGLLASLKANIAAPFGYVESAGGLFGVLMTARTLFPQGFQDTLGRLRDWLIPPLALAPTVHLCGDEHEVLGISLEERIFYAEAGLRVMGLIHDFAPLVVLCGHGGETQNNPYAAGLDCGACGGNPGGPNARIMAAVYNDPEVRAGLRERGIVIPDSTVFCAAEHNTTTDELRFYQLDSLKEQHPLLSERLLVALERARQGASAERAARLPGAIGDSVQRTQERAADWAQVRPEWGLARNAAFIVASRQLTTGLDLEGRTFLHSYDWGSDADGKALEIILTAPMVVAEWINTQYYFSTVDNSVYGSGSKTTHNVVGKIGVMQGNASDLMSGLPMQSLLRADGELYHQPLRLMTVVQAPVDRVTAVIERNDILRTLFDNEWVALTVLDPDNGQWLRHRPGRRWESIDSASRDVAADPASMAALSQV